MGLRKSFLILFFVLIAFVGITLFIVLNHSHENLVEVEVKKFGEIITNQVLAERLAYSEIVEKLQKEGKGASAKSHELTGYIPLPAQYTRSISQQVVANSDLYSYSLISEWNINENYGLKEDFDLWAWEKLKDQQAKFNSSIVDKSKAYPWKTIQRIEKQDGEDVLNMLTADPASSPSCVDCHNRLETSPEIIALRQKNGQKTRKEWKQHDLMGAIKVTVPLKTVLQETNHIQRDSIVSLSVVLLVCFGILVSFLFVKVINPVLELTDLTKRVGKSDLDIDAETSKIKALEN